MSRGTPINPDDYDVLTFDCYGTLIDWENGLLGYLQPLLQSYHINVIDEFVLDYFYQLEPLAQDEGGSYREVLKRVIDQFAIRLGFTATDETRNGLADSIQYWQPFTDAQRSLHKLHKHFKLAVVSNIDDELFADSQALLEVDFDHVVTAQQAGCYKPDPRIFESAFRQVDAPGRILHVAQSRFHDIVPATALGIDTVWIDRASRGTAQAVDATPTWTYSSMAEFTAALQT